MKGSRSILVLAIGAGILLAAMIETNSNLATWNSPAIASWIAHGSGAIVAWILLQQFKPSPSHTTKQAPWWSYLGGIPGAMTVWLAAIVVNSPLALTGSLALMLSGQIIFGFLADLGGWFGVIKRRFSMLDLFSIALIFSGTLILISHR
ncbi:MAG: hypothetical protein CENE_01730 [Candidatus Celerinatantimonas neptuna]|nr:MAG: hypothetical protein CENE_01730 [Candidatus Celerinatantimonas neptuna]